MATTAPERTATPAPAGGIPARSGALAGIAGGGAALAVGELVAGMLAPTPSLVTGVANRVVDNSPVWLTDLGKQLFGTDQKTALVIGTIVIALTIAAAVGVLSRRRTEIGVLAIVGFAFVGMLSIGSDAQGSLPAGAIIGVAGAVAGSATLVWLLGRAAVDGAEPVTPVATERSTIVEQSAAGAGGSGVGGGGRRRFVRTLGAVGVGSVVAAVGGRLFRSASSAQGARAAIEVDTADPELAADIANAVGGEVAGTPEITPLVVPNDEFYRIDTALVVPQVDPDDWTLTIDGMVDAPRTYTFADLLDRADLVAPVTLSCVSNPVGGDLVGNAVWRGVPLTALLDDVGVQPGATQIASRSVDGWTCGFPTDVAYDGRTAMVAIAMNDEALPLEHGFPARLVVSGLYGYVSATKWLQSITLTTLEDFDGYWIPRGWSKLGPVKTQSRIDTPRSGESLVAGVERAIAGVAWAPDTGIERVEVQIDDGPWLEAELGESLGINAWRQWRVRWTPEAGRHQLRVRATDASGETQTEERTAVAPDGATGWHTIDVRA